MKIEPFRMTTEEKKRYSRQLLLFQSRGQRKLKKSRVLVVGAGGLGSVASRYMAMSGAGMIRIVDSGRVDFPDLNRQFYTVDDLGKPKVAVLAGRLRELNPNVVVEPEYCELSEKNARDMVEWANIVLDCLDNLKSRLILSRACKELSRPLIHGAAEGFRGSQITCMPGEPYLDKIYSGKRGSRGKLPVAGPMAGVIGALQALEAVKAVTGCGRHNKKLLVFDGKRNRTEYIEIK